MIDIDRTLTALADPTRRGIIDVLSKRPHRAGELAKAFGVSAPAMSQHLRVLRMRGLIEDERVEEDARVRVFRLRRQPLAELSKWLDGIETFWNEQLASFKAHVASRAKGEKQ
jgi:DNA-binding transcriptional ArsR family regulator